MPHRTGGRLIPRCEAAAAPTTCCQSAAEPPALSTGRTHAYQAGMTAPSYFVSMNFLISAE